MTARDPGEQLRRLERRVRLRVDVRRSLERAWHSVPAALQIVVAATAAYAIAHFWLGHSVPLLAVTMTISALGFARDARPRRVLEAVIGILVGIVLSEALVLVVGKGVWQLALVLFVTLIVARAITDSGAFAVVAGVQSMLVLLLPDPDGGVFIRSLDGLIGGVIALLVTALLPRDPRRAALADGRTLYSVLTESAESVVAGLAQADEAAADLALNRLRRTQSLIDGWTASLDSAVGIARIAPLLRRHLPELRGQERALTAADLSARHLRLIARRIEFLVRDGRKRPELAGLFSELATAIRLLGAELDDQELAGASRSLLSDLAARLTPEQIVPGAPVTDSIVVLLARPLVVDLLIGTGMDAERARALLAEV